MEDKIEIFKALSDKNRLLILDMLSCGERCACDLQEGLNLTQPTISHHMKVLQQSGLVGGRKEGKWIYYFINQEVANQTSEFINYLTSHKDDCICKQTNENSACKA